MTQVKVTPLKIEKAAKFWNKYGFPYPPEHKPWRGPLYLYERIIVCTIICLYFKEVGHDKVPWCHHKRSRLHRYSAVTGMWYNELEVLEIACKHYGITLGRQVRDISLKYTLKDIGSLFYDFGSN